MIGKLNKDIKIPNTDRVLSKFLTVRLSPIVSKPGFYFCCPDEWALEWMLTSKTSVVVSDSDITILVE